MIRHQNGLLLDVVESLTLEVFKSHLVRDIAWIQGIFSNLSVSVTLTQVQGQCTVNQ